MAQGGIVSFEPAQQPGAYQATMADGSQQMFFGQSADEFYKRRQASAALGPQALAQNDVKQPQMGPPPPPTASDVPQNPVTRLPGGGVSIPISAARAITRGEKVIPEPPKPGEKPSDVPENPKAPAKDERDGYKIGQEMGYMMPTVINNKEVFGPAVMTENGPRVMIRGTHGSPGGLTAQGKQLVGRQIGTEHAIAQGRELETAGMAEGTRLASEDAQQQFDYLKEQQRQAIIQQHDQEEENRQLEERVQKMDASYQAARDEFKTSKVDSGRYMRGNWMAVLGSALGAAGAALARTPNFAMDFVSQNIDRDIRSQEREIEVKGKTADNALADLVRSQGSLQAGKGALKQLLLEKAANQAGMISASTKTQSVKAEATRLAGQLMQKYSEGDLERTKGYVDQVYKDRTYYSPGSAGTSGGLYTPTQESIEKATHTGIDVEKLAVEKAKAEAEKAGGNTTPLSSDRTEKLSSYATALEAAEAVKKELAARGATDDSVDDPTAGLIDKARYRQSNERLNQNTTQLAKGLQSAFGKSDRDAEDAQKMAEGGGSGRDRYQAAERNEKKLITNIRTELSTLPPAQVQQVLSTLPASVKAKVLGQKEPGQ
jgi:hypothetical protein